MNMSGILSLQSVVSWLNLVFRFQRLYKDHASRVGEEGSKISPKQEQLQVKCNQNSNLKEDHVTVMDQSKAEQLSRDLPHWMLKKESKSNSSGSSLERSESDMSSERKIR